MYPFHVPEVRNGVTHLEADVLYEDRVRYDYGITGIIDLPDLQFDITGADIKPAEWGKVPFITPYPVYLDIETKPNDTDKNKQDILSIAIYEPHSDTAYIMVNVDPHPERATLGSRTVEIRDKVIASLNERGMYVSKTISIIFLRDEKERGDYFRTYLRMRQPDILVAWNGWDFDFNILEEKYITTHNVGARSVSRQRMQLITS